MLFNSYVFFLAFLPVFLIGYFLVKSRSELAAGVFVAAMSLLFYVPFGWQNLAVLAGSIALNMLLAWRIAACRGDAKAPGKPTAAANSDHSSAGGRIYLALAVVANIACLLFFKFAGPFFPVAISFYTFNQISYLVDLYRGDVERFSPLDQLTYILFFPKLLQGPLMSYSDFAKELSKSLTSRLDWERVLRGLFLFSLGLFKKVILADTFGVAVNYGFDSIATLGSLEALLVAVFYSFQLYFDFSGYCDMAAGIGVIMDFEHPLNFDSPYKAVNIVDFWKRWHITLTRFFTKYVYIPLGGNRKGAVRMYANLMLVFLLSGLWHGNGWNFIVWGAMHGTLYLVTRAMQRRTKTAGTGTGKVAKEESHNSSEDVASGSTKTRTVTDILATAIKRLLTFTYVTAAWVFFRARTVADAVHLITRIFTGGSKPIAAGISSAFQLDEIWYVIKVTPIMRLPGAWDSCLWLFLIVAVFMIFFRDNAINMAKKAVIGLGTTVLTAILLIWCILSFAGVSTFLYMNF